VLVQQPLQPRQALHGSGLANEEVVGFDIAVDEILLVGLRTDELLYTCKKERIILTSERAVMESVCRKPIHAIGGDVPFGVQSYSRH
jgi:hypothetical protein